MTMRWVLRVLGLVLTLVLVAMLALAFVPAEKVAALAAGEFRKATGRALTIDGPVRPTLWPTLGVRIGGLAVADADWAGPEPMLEAEALSVALDAAALFGGEIRIIGIEVADPVLRLTRAADGRANWDFGPAAAAPVGGGSGAASADRPFSLDRLTVTGGRVIYRDAAAGQAHDLRDLALDTAVPALDGPVTATLTGLLNAAPLAARLDLARLSDVLDGRLAGVLADIDLAGATARFDGRIGGAPLTAEGSVALAATGLSAPFAALGLPAPDLPAGFGRDRLTLDAALTWDGATLFLRDLAAALDGTRVTGALDIATAGPRPRITADLAAGPLVLPSGETGGGGGSGNSSGAPGAGWSTAPIDVSALGLADATVALRAEALAAGALRVGPVRLLARLDDRRLVLDIAELGAYGGSVTGQAVVNGRGGLSVSADLTAGGVSLQPLLAAAAGYDRLLATAEGRVRLLASGGSVDALVRSLSGEGRVALGQGELRGLDLAGMIRNLDPGYVGAGQKTIFDSVTASFTVAGGVLANDDLAFVAALLRAEGRGRVDLGARTLDYRLVPTALPGADGSGGVRVPVLITGPWAAPRIALDLEALAEERLKIEEEKVRAAAEAALKARAAEIGIAPAEGQSLEDAARQKLEDRAEEVLKREGDKLLRGLLGN